MGGSMIGDRMKTANKLRDFADRVESGELDVVEIELHEDTPHVKVEGMPADELTRLHTVFFDE